MDDLSFTATDKAQDLVLALESIDDMIDTLDGNTMRAILVITLASAVKGGRPAIKIMRTFLTAIDAEFRKNAMNNNHDRPKIKTRSQKGRRPSR